MQFDDDMRTKQFMNFLTIYKVVDNIKTEGEDSDEEEEEAYEVEKIVDYTRVSCELGEL